MGKSKEKYSASMVLDLPDRHSGRSTVWQLTFAEPKALSLSTMATCGVNFQESQTKPCCGSVRISPESHQKPNSRAPGSLNFRTIHPRASQSRKVSRFHSLIHSLSFREATGKLEPLSSLTVRPTTSIHEFSNSHQASGQSFRHFAVNSSDEQLDKQTTPVF